VFDQAKEGGDKRKKVYEKRIKLRKNDADMGLAGKQAGQNKGKNK